MIIFNKKPFLIANIGFNFYEIAIRENISNLEAAELLILEAKKCGINAVKFYLPPEDNLAWDNENLKNLNPQFLLDYYDNFTKEEYEYLADFCLVNDMVFIATPFDFESVDYSFKFTDIYSILSSDLNNTPFIKYVASKNKPIILYTGGATLGEIKNALRIIEKNSTADVVLMHSVLSFPTDYRDANLFMIKDLADNFPDCEIGYCDHTKTDSNMLLLTTAFNYGADIIEKYFTIDKSIKVNVHSYSMDSDDVLLFNANLGFLSTVNGMKSKHPLICESTSIRHTRRSIVSKRDIKKGETLTENDVTFKWPSYGMSPDNLDDILGKKARCDIAKDAVIDFEMLN